MEIGEITIIEITTDQITEIDPEADGIIIGQVIGATAIRQTIDKVIIDPITDKTLNGHLETEAKVEIELEVITMIIREVGAEIEVMTGPFNQDKMHHHMEEMNLGPDPTLG